MAWEAPWLRRWVMRWLKRFSLPAMDAPLAARVAEGPLPTVLERDAFPGGALRVLGRVLDATLAVEDQGRAAPGVVARPGGQVSVARIACPRKGEPGVHDPGRKRLGGGAPAAERLCAPGSDQAEHERHVDA